MSAFNHPSLHGQIVTIFGGTGFVGRHIIAVLVAAGARVKVATRHKNSAYLLRLYGTTGQVVPVSVSYKSEDSVDAAIAGSTMVVNCLGILQENGKNNLFSHVHNDIPLWMARSCTKRHITRFVHISALGVDHSRSRYAISKIKGEFGVTSVYPAATILRPSIIFGPEDSFFNRFAALAKISPALPLIGGGHTRFQPVYVGDVAKAVLTALTNPQTAGHIYELGGPEVLSF
ncbi:MAG: complex I NDUFA9 subunit family protein, partial [Pseudomonadota bacterium]